MNRGITHRTDEPLLFQHPEVDRVQRLEVIQEHHVKLHWSGHVEGLPEGLDAGRGATDDDLLG